MRGTMAKFQEEAEILSNISFLGINILLGLIVFSFVSTSLWSQVADCIYSSAGSVADDVYERRPLDALTGRLFAGYIMARRKFIDMIQRLCMT